MFWERVWAEFTVNGRLTDMEAIIGIILSVICTFLYVRHSMRKSERDNDRNIINEIGLDGYYRLRGRYPDPKLHKK